MSHGALLPLPLLIRRFRLAAGLSQEELAEKSGLSTRTISDLERGLRRIPRLETIRMVADGLGLTDAQRASLLSTARPELIAGSHGPGNEVPAQPGGEFSTVPQVPGAFIGREQEVAALISMLSRPATRLITLTGPGGVGKTRLAIAVAHKIATAFEGGVVFVALAQVRAANLVIPAIARALGVREAGERALIDRVQDVLADRAVLLVLDNMEQVVEAGPDVTALLSANDGLKTMVTSRGALRLSGEYRYPVPVLPLPTAEEQQPLEKLASAAAVALFIDRAQMSLPGFALTQGNAHAVIEICHRLDGLPLAIELAAAHIPLLPPVALLARMERRLPLLTGGARDLPERLQTMRAAIDWSYELLSPQEKAVFRRLAVFDGGFTPEAGEKVAAIDGEGANETAYSTNQLDYIVALAERSLIWQTEQPDGEARFGMLETIREFGLEQLQASGEWDAVHRAHTAWYLAFAEAFDAGGRAAAINSLDRVERELPNFRVALSSADNAEQLRLAHALMYLWELRSHRTEGRGWLQAALARGSNVPSAVHSAALESLSLLEHNLGNPELGTILMNQALELRRVQNDRRGITLALVALAEFAIDAGDDERAIKILAEIEEWAADPGNRIDVPASALNSRGILSRRLGKLQQAKEYFTDAVARFDRSGDAYGRAIAREFLGLVQCDCRDFALSATSYLESLEDWRMVGTRESLIDWLAMVATLAAAVGDPIQSCRLFGAVEAQAEILGFNFPLPEREEFERVAATVRIGPGDPNWTSGRMLSLDQATAEAVGWLSPVAMAGNGSFLAEGSS